MYFHVNFHKTIKYVPSISMSTLMFYAMFSLVLGHFGTLWDGPRWSCLARPMPRWLWPERRRPLKTRVRKLRKVRKSWRAGNCSRSWTDVPFFSCVSFFWGNDSTNHAVVKSVSGTKKHKQPDFTGVYRMPHVKLIPTTGTRTTPKKWKQ